MQALIKHLLPFIAAALLLALFVIKDWMLHLFPTPLTKGFAKD